MADIIDDAEGAVGLVILLGIVALGIWGYSEFKKLFPDGLPNAFNPLPKAKDAVLGGAGTPGTPQYVSGEENVRRWWNNYFPNSDSSDADTPDVTYLEPLESTGDMLDNTEGLPVSQNTVFDALGNLASQYKVF
jgi:hypothetical protein